MVIYYNPECSKCREALDLLEAQHCSVEIRNYLAAPPTLEEIRELLRKLNCKAVDLVRTKEPLFQASFIGRILSEEEWITMLSENPVLIERPIVIDGNRAVIGRTPVRVLELLKK